MDKNNLDSPLENAVYYLAIVSGLVMIVTQILRQVL